MKDRSWEVEGVEIDEKAALIATEILSTQVLSPERWQPEPDRFDVITLWHVLEHLPEPEKRLADFYRALRPGGLLLIAVPNTASHDRSHYGGDWAAWDVPIHLWHFQRLSIRKLFEGCGFEAAGEEPMPFDSFYISMLSERNRKNPFWWISGVWQGWVSRTKTKQTKEGSSMIWFAKKPD
jgi:SAM-dependent methyltransferase